MQGKINLEEKRARDLVSLIMWRASIESLRGLHPELVETYETYAGNVNRVCNLARFAPMVALMAMSIRVSSARATYEELGTFVPKRTTTSVRQSIRMRMTPVEYDIPMPTDKTLTRKVSHLFHHAMGAKDKQTDEGLDALGISLAVLAWTAFETLCEDLSEKAIDIRTQQLCAPDLKGRKSLRPMQPWEVSLAGKSHKFSSDSRGPKKRELLKYRTILGIRDSYWITFYTEGKGIDRVLNHRTIDTLHAVRNAMVHKGGTADDLFLKRVQGLPEFSHATFGNPIDVDLGTVKTLVKSVLGRGIALIAVVNKWIMKRP